MVWPAILAAGASIWGQHSANQASIKEAQKNRQFQERMSSTSHQREVADLKAAGLNPLLSVNQGSSTPQGAMSPIKNVVDPSTAKMVSIDNQRLKSEIYKNKNLGWQATTQANVNRAQKQYWNAQTKSLEYDNTKRKFMSDFYNTKIGKGYLYNQLLVDTLDPYANAAAKFIGKGSKFGGTVSKKTGEIKLKKTR